MPQRVDHPMGSPIDTIAILLIYLDTIRPSIVDAILHPLSNHHRTAILHRIREFGPLSPDDIRRYLDQLPMNWPELLTHVMPLHRHFSSPLPPPESSNTWKKLAEIPIPQLGSFMPHAPFDLQLLILQSLPTSLQAELLGSLPDHIGPSLLKGLHHPRTLYPSALLSKLQNRVIAQIQQHVSQSITPVLASLPHLPSNKRIKWLCEWEQDSPGTLYQLISQSFPFNGSVVGTRLFDEYYPTLSPEIQRVLSKTIPNHEADLPIPEGGVDPPLEVAMATWWSAIVRGITEKGWDPWE